MCKLEISPNTIILCAIAMGFLLSLFRESQDAKEISISLISGGMGALLRSTESNRNDKQSTKADNSPLE